MGNFSVSHYSRIDVSAKGAEVEYVLDFAEIPTFELLQEWNLKPNNATAEFQLRVSRQAREWTRHIKVEAGGRAVTPQFERATAVLDKGAGDMPILRVVSEFHLPVAATSLTYEDGNYPDRAGWKEIVIRAAEDSIIRQATPSGADRSYALTAYPQDPLLAPPQDLRASVAWQSTAPAVQPMPAPPAAPVTAQTTPIISRAQPGQTAPGMVVRGDFLSRLMHQGEIGWGMMLLGIGAAFCLGAVHALSPGHGKTIVAAYLVGSRGTPKHAAILGGLVTFTHTISVFFLGFVTLFLSRYLLPEKLYPILGSISGISIVWIGGLLLHKRLAGWNRARHTHSHPHHHHDHDHNHAHVHSHDGGRPHSHVPEGEVSLASLIALGATGGLVPCPSALVLLLSSIAIGRVGLGLVLLIGFSTGLAIVLTGIGMTVLYAKHLLPDTQKAANSGLFRLLPVVSAAIIMCVGIIMTGVSLGVISPIVGV
jgi:ABC-type nickel/cobalt efflux system permease component RcnA